MLELIFDIDLSRDEVDALFEISVVLEVIREITEKLKPQNALQVEYLPSLGKNSWENRDCLGNILIIGENTAPIALSIIPLAFAIAAGNTALVILPFETPNVTVTLQKIIRLSIDVEAFAAFAPTSEENTKTLIQNSRRSTSTGYFITGRLLLRILALFFCKTRSK